MNKYLLLFLFLVWSVIIASVSYKATMYFNPCSDAKPITIHDTIMNPVPVNTKPVNPLLPPKPLYAKKSFLHKILHPFKHEIDSEAIYQAQYDSVLAQAVVVDSVRKETLCDSTR